jgi:glycosyltransferase involved in cell wall biosynthesis
MKEKNKDCIVVIPTHKPALSPEEEISFRNTLDVLSDWDITLFLPHDVSREHFDAIQVEDNLEFRVMNGIPGWMGSIRKYNDMALSPEFYRLFKDYKYILICHLDAWVFRDELRQWIARDYDYIGPPWFLMRRRRYVDLGKLMCPQGGNGGFCLRKVDKMIELTTEIKRSVNIALFLKGVSFLLKNGRLRFLMIYMKSCLMILLDAEAYRRKYNIYEDGMISIFYSLLDKSFNVAPAEEAMYFATEVYSDEIFYSKLQWQLPFGIHGYDKYLEPGTIEKYANDKARNSFSISVPGNGDDLIDRSNKTPLITVVTATYNIIESGRLEVFRQCMESVHQQTYKNIEHIIIDGASTDDTLEVIQDYVDKGLCVCYSEPDEGVWDALYRGHQRARGQFVNYMNSDDYFSRNDAVEIAVNALTKENADWFFSEGAFLRKDGSSSKFPTSLYGVFSCQGILHQTMFVRTDILKRINPFHSDHVTRENYLMMILCVNNLKHAYSKESLVCYREGGFSLGEYCGSIEQTKDDFAQYYHEVIGRFWGMTVEECRMMFSWQCFNYSGVRYSYRLSKKLKNRGLRWSFRRKLLKAVLRRAMTEKTWIARSVLNQIKRLIRGAKAKQFR